MNNKKIKFLGLHKLSHKQWLERLSNFDNLEHEIDSYNKGPLVEKLESKVAKLLGKERAIFFHKGTISQLTALKVNAEQKNNNKIIIHPKSHIAFDEKEAYNYVTGLDGLLLGKIDQPFNFEELKKVDNPVSSLVVELPLRRVGFKLTPWQDLEKMSRWCQQHNCHFHMDGARLWESTYYYKKSLAEIASLFDSVYVSLYKGIGAIGGSLLAGDNEFIEKCKVWRSRLGGDAWTAFPSLLTAIDGIDKTLPEIESWVIRAHEIANKLSTIEGLSVNTPETNAFLIFIDGDLESINKKADRLSLKTGLRLFNSFFKVDFSNKLAAEIQVGKDHHAITNKEIINYFNNLIAGT